MCILQCKRIATNNRGIGVDVFVVYITLYDIKPLARFLRSKGEINVSHAGEVFYPDSTVSSLSVCAQACINYPNFTCNSFYYCTSDRQRTCRLSGTYTINTGQSLPSVVCDQYTRKYSESFKDKVSFSKGVRNSEVAIEIIIYKSCKVISDSDVLLDQKSAAKV